MVLPLRLGMSSHRAHIVASHYRMYDAAAGIGPCYASKANRTGIRVGELINFDHFSSRLPKVQSIS